MINHSIEKKYDLKSCDLLKQSDNDLSPSSLVSFPIHCTQLGVSNLENCKVSQRVSNKYKKLYFS